MLILSLSPKNRLGDNFMAVNKLKTVFEIIYLLFIDCIFGYPTLQSETAYSTKEREFKDYSIQSVSKA
jgi:hypothetical protein